MAYALEKWTSDLHESGFVEYPLESYGLAAHDLKFLKAQTDENQVEYIVLRGGDTGEVASAEVYRLKHPANQNICLEDCVNILSSEVFTNFIIDETGISNFDIDRIQAHIYRPGDFLAEHVDAESSEYLYTFIFILQKAEEGGEFVISLGNEKVVLNPEEGTLIVLDARLPHEVRPVKRGVRKTLCAFMRGVETNSVLAG